MLSELDQNEKPEMTALGKDEVAIQKFAASVPLREIGQTNFTKPKPLHLKKVAIVTAAALYRVGGEGFELVDSDYHYEILPRGARNLVCRAQ